MHMEIPFDGLYISLMPSHSEWLSLLFSFAQNKNITLN